jgi:hypothetical protein
MARGTTKVTEMHLAISERMCYHLAIIFVSPQQPTTKSENDDF